MQAWMRSWRGATALAAGCLLLGLVRVVTAPLDELTVIAFLVAVGYAVAAVVDHRAEHARHPAASRIAAWPSVQHGTPHDRDGAMVSATVVVTPSTKDRIAAVVATAAAVVGFVLVLQDRETNDQRTPAGPTSSVSEFSRSPG